MRLGMIRNGVPTCDHICCDFRKLANVLADHEKCGSRSVLVQKIEQLRRCRWIWSIVERERDGARIARSPPRRAEQLRRRHERTPRAYPRECCSRSRSRRRYCSRIHLLNFRTRAPPRQPKIVHGDSDTIRALVCNPCQNSRHNFIRFRHGRAGPRSFGL